MRNFVGALRGKLCVPLVLPADQSFSWAKVLCLLSYDFFSYSGYIRHEHTNRL